MEEAARSVVESAGRAGEDAAKAFGAGLGNVASHSKTAEDALRSLNDAQSTLAVATERAAAAQLRYHEAVNAANPSITRVTAAHAALLSSLQSQERATQSVTAAQEKLNATHQTAIGYLAHHSASLGEWALAAGAAATAAVGLVGALAHIGETFEEINRGIELTNASTGEAMDGLKQHADALVGTVDTATNQIGADMGTLATRLQTGPGAALDALTENVGMLRDRFGQLNTAELASGFREFHVEAGQASDALASLTQSAIGAAAPVGTVVNQLAAGGTILAAAGLNYQQAAYFISQATKDISDGGAQKAVSAIEMAGKAMADPKINTRGLGFTDFIKSAYDSIQYFESSADPAIRKLGDDLSEEVFGSRKWLEAKALVDDWTKSLHASGDALQAPAGYMDDLQKKTHNLDNTFHELRNHIEAALAPPGQNAVDVIGDKVQEFIGWIDAHRDDLRSLFTSALDAAEDVIKLLTTVGGWLARYPGLIETVVIGFAAWKTLEGVAALITSLQAIDALLKGLPAASALAGAGITTGLAPAITAMTTLLALFNQHSSGADPNLGPGGDDRQKRLEAGKSYADSHGGQVPPGYGQWLDKGGAPPPGITMPGAAPGTPIFDAQGRLLGADGKPFPGASSGPTPYIPGSQSQVAGVAPPAPPGAPAAPGGAPSDLIMPDEHDPKGKKGPRLPVAPEVPYGAGFGEAPRPGESAKQYEQEQNLLEARHKIDEDVARLNQLEADNNATADDIQKARNKLLHDQSDLYKTEERQTKGATEGLEQMGAKIDKDFGISKGLPGIAENLTKFLANLAMAPVMGALQGANAAIGGPTYGGKGLIGAAALGGAFGSQFTPETLAAEGASPTGRGGGGLSAVLGPGGPVMGAATGTGGGQGGPGGFLGNISAAGASGIPSAAPGSGAEGWRNTVAAVVDKYGPAMGVTPANRQSWIDNIVRQIGTESHGDPRASNPHDSDGRGGTQDVEGLLQYLPSSYAASGGKLTGLPYMDPVGQIAGALFAPRDANGFPVGIGHGQGWGPNTGTPINQSLLPQRAPTTPGGRVPGFNPSQAQGGWHPTPPAGPPAPGGGWQPGVIPGLTGIPGYADGGATPPPTLPGGGVPIVAHEGEHVLTSSDVQALGGQSGVYAMRQSLNPQPGATAPQAPPPPEAPQPQMAAVPSAGPTAARPGVPSGPRPGPSMIGGISPSAGYGSGFQVTGGGLVGVAESLPATAISMGMAAAAAALYGGSIEDLAHYDEGGAVPSSTAGAGGGGSPGGAGGGGSPGSSSIGALIGIGMQEINEAVSKGGQAAGALVGGVQQTFGLQQFAQSKQAQSGWVSKLVGGITGAQPQLPNTAGPKSGTPGLTPEQAASQQGGADAAAGDTHYNGAVNNGVHIEQYNVHSTEDKAGADLGRSYTAAVNSQTGSR